LKPLGEFASSLASSRTYPCAKPRPGTRLWALRRASPARAAAAGRLPAACRLHAIGAVRWARTARSKGGIPLRSVHRGPVDRVHRRRSTSLRQHRVSSSQSQLATWHSLSLSAGCLGNFAKRTPSFQNSQVYPSTYIKAFQLGPCFYV
jgi:hypothetical protein